jgi:hypothetical protein
MADSTGQNLTDDTSSDHERLFNDYQQLESTLSEVKQEFSHFANHIA